jgi:hypothetical protein
MIRAGTTGKASLKNHKPACKGPTKGVARKNTDIFAPKARAPLVPSTACAAPLVTSANTSFIENDASFASSPSREVSPSSDENMEACLDSCPKEDSPSTVHQVLMLDEIAIERRARYDDQTNKVVGVCQQHGYKVPLDLETEKDLEVLCEGLKSGKAHLAGEVCCLFLLLLSVPDVWLTRRLWPRSERPPKNWICDSCREGSKGQRRV